MPLTPLAFWFEKASQFMDENVELGLLYQRITLWPQPLDELISMEQLTAKCNEDPEEGKDLLAHNCCAVDDSIAYPKLESSQTTNVHLNISRRGGWIASRFQLCARLLA